MKKAKIYLSLLLSILLLTGCDTEYNLSFDNGKIEEHVEWTVKELIEISDVDGIPVDASKTIYYAYDEPSAQNEYQKEVKKDGNRYRITLDYAHDPSNFGSAIAFKYFKYPFFLNAENSYFIKLTGGLLNGIEDKIEGTIKIKFHTKNRVIQNNADEIDGDTYIWNITKHNAPTKEILFQVSKTEEEVIERGGNLVITGLVLLALLGLLPLLLWGLIQKLFDKLTKRNKT